MMNREMKLAIGEELQTLFHPIVSATKQAAEKTAEGLAPVKKAIEDIDGTLKAQNDVPLLILYKNPRPQHYTSDDYSVYKAIVAQIRVRAI